MNMMAIPETDISFMEDTTPQTALQAIVGMAPGLEEYVGDRLASAMKVRHFSECLPANSNENGFFVVNDYDPSKSDRFKGPFPSRGDYYWAVTVTGFRLKYPTGLGKKKHEDSTLGDG